MKRTIHLHIVIFLMAFCSLSYEFVLATELSHIFNEGIFVYPAILSAFILSMGAGSLLWHHKHRKGIHYRNAIFLVEIALIIIGCMSVWLIDLSYIHQFASPAITAFVITLIIGFLTGQELPLIFIYAEEHNLSPKTVRRMLFFDYLASFFASLVMAFILFPLFDTVRIAWIISVLNLLTLFLLLIFFPPRSHILKWFSLIFAAIALGIYAFLFRNAETIEERLITNILIDHEDTKALLVEKIHTPYQRISLFAFRMDGAPVTNKMLPEILVQPDDYRLAGYLNWTVQFSHPLSYEADFYHVFLTDPFIELLPNIKKVLILGGGDGLPAKQLIKYDQIEHITMVDIDEEWVSFSRDNPYMKKVNNNALNHPKIHLKFEDAFTWIARSKEKFDAIFIDFPAETNLAAIRVSTVQFSSDLKRLLNDGGVIINQGDNEVPLEVFETIRRTGYAAGLWPLMGYDTQNEDFTFQNVLFKEKETRDKFLTTYQNEYAPFPKRFQHRDGVLGHVTYLPADDNVPACCPLSIYDPNILGGSLGTSQLPFEGVF